MNTASDTRRDNPAVPWIIVGIIVVVALIIRLFRLEEKSLWNDEMFTFDVVSGGFGSIQQILLAKYHHPPLYFYLAKISTQLFGSTAWAIRLPSAIFGALTAGLIYISLPDIKKMGGLAASILCTVAPFHIAYSQEGRPYAVAGFLCLLSTQAFIGLMQRPGRWRQIYYITSSTALLYTHHWGVFVLISHTIAQIITAKKLKGHAVTAWMVIGLLYLPEFLALRAQIAGIGATSWFWADPPGFGEIFHLATAFSGTYFTVASGTFSLPAILQIIGTLSVVLLVLIAALKTLETTPGRQVYLAALCGTLMIPWIISFIKPEIFLWYRYTVIAFPIFCVIAGEISDSRTIGLSIVSRSVLFVLIIIGATGTAQYYSWQKSNIKDVSEYVTAITASDVKIVIRPKTVAPLLNYYYHGNAVQYDEAYLETPLGGIVDTAASFLYISLDVPNQIRDYMDGHFLKAEQRRYPGVAHMGIVAGVYRQKP